MDASPNAHRPIGHTPTIPDPHRAAVVAALAKAVDRYPELGWLRATLGDDLRVTPEFVAGARDPSISYGRRSLLLRILVGDPSAGGAPAAHQVRGATLQRFIDWAALIGALDSGDGQREDVPKGFAAMLGVSRSTFTGFVANALVRPWWEVLNGGRPRPPALADLPVNELSALEVAFNARRLTLAGAERMLTADGRSPKEAVWVFDTGCAALDLRNTMVFLAVLFAANREGGRIQNRVPVALSARWNLRRLSLPDAMGFADVASLAVQGLLQLDDVEEEWIGLAETLASAKARELVAGSADDVDATVAMQRHATRWILGAPTAANELARLVHGSTAGTFDTGFMFNAARLIRRRPFDAFAGYYDAVDPTALAAAAAERWGMAPTAIQSTVKVVAPNAPAIAVRDFGNIAAVLTALGCETAEDAWRVLPNVARLALGAPEPKAAGTRQRHEARHHAAEGGDAQRTGQLPLFKALLAGSRGAEAILLRPGALKPAGTVPCFVARAEATGRTVPPGVTLVGTSPLPWDADPVSDAVAVLRERGYVVRVVTR